MASIQEQLKQRREQIRRRKSAILALIGVAFIGVIVVDNAVNNNSNQNAPDSSTSSPSEVTPTNVPTASEITPTVDVNRTNTITVNLAPGITTSVQWDSIDCKLIPKGLGSSHSWLNDFDGEPGIYGRQDATGKIVESGEIEELSDYQLWGHANYGDSLCRLEEVNP